MNKEDYYIKEKELVNQPKAIPLGEMIQLVDIIKTHICKITCKDGTYGTGFFCYIPIGWGDFLTVLMTNNHVLNIKDIQPGETINFSINNDFKEYNILIDKNRKIYTNESFDITIIEIKEYDKIDIKSFFDLDNQIFQEDSINLFRNRQIYLLHYPKGVKMEISHGIIKNINVDKGKKTIYHLFDTSGGSSGSPIINAGNFKVIGIHKGPPRGGQNYNLGTLLKEPIEKFTEEIKKKKIKKDKNENFENFPLTDNNKPSDLSGELADKKKNITHIEVKDYVSPTLQKKEEGGTPQT